MRFPVTQSVPTVRVVTAADAMQIPVFTKKAAIFQGSRVGFVFVRQSADAESSADSVGAV